MKIILHKPVVVSQAPPHIRNWGPWQFPLIHKLENGRLLIEFHREADSATAYGLPPGQAISDDNGITWHEISPPNLIAGLKLPDGSYLRAIQKQSIPAKNLSLPSPLAFVQSSYVTYTYYKRSELPPELQKGWFFLRRLPGSDSWHEEQAQVELPDEIAYTTENVFVFPFFEHDRIHVAHDGRLVATLYGSPQIAQGRIIVRRFLAMFVESLDNGKTWRMKSAIPYYPDIKKDPLWDARDGFSEPQIAFMPDGSIMMLLRTNDGNGNGPMYVARSKDNGITWSKPHVFDSLGVWPQLLVLKNNVTIISYGRPGLYLRASEDPSGQKWTRKITIVKPDKTSTNTCSYSDLIQLEDNSALIVYSDFNWPDQSGRPCKSIMTRRIEIIK